ncbi:TPR repeat [Fulvimarina manganoxydans]|uniref:TPR repeat n=1 Tax=Fulvimarina manganoxydans TaxID=937218 RepID=A0A1W2ETV6_9HYPH|nr:SEL1-like repeat protein [Fulvimarina manganoxydans]SMD13137.1 TPR repeat [Fulvimarina manganoxydans]
MIGKTKEVGLKFRLLSTAMSAMLVVGATYSTNHRARAEQSEGPPPSTGEASAASSERGLLSEPPQLDYATLCPTPEATEVSRDWTVWDGGETVAEPGQMLADARIYAEGGLVVARNKPLVRRMLEHIASRLSVATPEAKRQLALLLIDPEAGKTDPERAEALLKEALASQNMGASLSLGRLYRTGVFQSTDPLAAPHYLNLAAGLGDPRAALELAEYYATPGVAQPFPGAQEHFRALAMISAQPAIVRGDCGLLVDIGDFFAASPSPADQKTAAAWYETSANMGNPSAEMRLARQYQEGRGLPKNETKALELLQSAAAHGSIDAYTATARLQLQAGRDIDDALDYLDVGRTSRDLSAYLLTARFYRGDFTGQANFEKMVATLDEAATLSAASVTVLVDQAYAYLEGRGVPADEAKADALFERIAQIDTPEAQLEVGRYMLRRGTDIEAAKYNFSAAGAAGDSSALGELAEIMRCVPGAATEAEALAAEQVAAEAGNLISMRRLARLALEAGDEPSARRWLDQATMMGDRLAMVELATVLSEKGRGKPDERVDQLVRLAGLLGEGVVDGRLALAKAYHRGELIGTDADASSLLTALAESGDDGVAVEMATQFQSSDAADRPLTKDLFDFVSRAAEHGNPDAMVIVAKQKGREGDKTGEADWLLKAAQHGQEEALVTFAKSDETRDSVLASVSNRVVCDPMALARIGTLYFERGKGGDSAVGETYLRQAERLAAERLSSLYRLGKAFASGELGTADLDRAISLFHEAAGRGHMRAAIELASLLTGGKGVDRRFDEAVGWLQAAGMAGEEKAVRELVSYSGYVARTPDERRKALRALQDIAASGRSDAMLAFGSVLAASEPKRLEEGIGFIRRSAEDGNVDAMKALSRLYASGLAGSISAEESTRWTRLAAEQGDPEAMFQYALALDLGFGVEADRQAASLWHEKARENGFIQ